MPAQVRARLAGILQAQDAKDQKAVDCVEEGFAMWDAQLERKQESPMLENLNRDNML